MTIGGLECNGFSVTDTKTRQQCEKRKTESQLLMQSKI